MSSSNSKHCIADAICNCKTILSLKYAYDYLLPDSNASNVSESLTYEAISLASDQGNDSKSNTAAAAAGKYDSLHVL